MKNIHFTFEGAAIFKCFLFFKPYVCFLMQAYEREYIASGAVGRQKTAHIT